MKQEKFFEILALTTAISSHISIIYLYIKQTHNHNFLIRNAIALFLLTIVNVILLLAYSHSRYNIYQLFDLGRNSEFKSIIKIANYSRCKQELKAIRVRNHVDRDFASQSTTDLFPKVRFQKVLNKKVNKEDRIYKIMLYCFILSFFLLFVAESWAILQCFTNVHNDLSYYYHDVSKINRVILIMTMFATVPALFFALYVCIMLPMFEKDKNMSISSEFCRCSSLKTCSSLPLSTSTNDIMLELLSTPESSHSPYNIPEFIPLLPSPTLSSSVFSFPSAPPEATLKVEVHSMLPSAGDIMPKLLDDLKPSSSGIGSSIRSSLISKSKLKQISTLTENVNTTSELSASPQPSLPSFRRIKSWPNLYEKEPLESVFSTSANDLIHNPPFTTIESWIPQLFSSGCSSSSPNLALKLLDNDIGPTSLSIKKLPSSLYPEYTC